MSRSDVAQQPPDPDLDVRLFPTAMLDPETRVYRAHNAEHGPWYFASDGGGRFDLDAPDGTLYTADSPGVAVREHLGDTIVQTQAVSEHRAQQMRVSVLLIGVDGDWANVSDPRASSFSITRELCTMTGYPVTQAWAALFASHRFAGIRYDARYSTGRGPDAWAQFGPGGARAAGVELAAEAIAGPDACRTAGLRVLPVPQGRSRLRVI